MSQLPHSGFAATLVATLLLALGCKKNEETKPSPSVGAHPNRGNQPAETRQPAELRDQDVTRAVQQTFERDPGVDEKAITVKTTNGIVELTGKASDILTRRRATMLAEGVKGVRAVSERLTLEPTKRSDAEIRKEVRDALAVNAATEAFEIIAEVENGVVSLSGTVESWQEKTLAERVAEGVRGVRDVKNSLQIDFDAKRTDAEIAADVRSRYAWDRLLNDGLLLVSVKDGTVRLSGVVGSAAEKRRARVNAWVNGTKTVDDSAVEVKWHAKSDDLRKNKFVRRSDAEIADAIRDAAALDPRVQSAGLRVDVDSSVVTLKGSVGSAKASMVAEALARNTVGVGSVKNELSIEPKKPVSDRVLAARVNNALVYDPTTDSYQIRVKVSEGTVTLEGKVETSFEKAQASDTVAGVSGVKRVENRIEVQRPELAYVHSWFVEPYDPYVATWHYLPARPTKSDPEIAEDIKDELVWSPFVDAEEVGVLVTAGKATLTGTVDSLAERAAAVENAFEGGAVAVENRLKVETGS